MKQKMMLLAVMMGSCIIASEAFAAQCRAHLYRRNGERIGQYTNERGCQEARRECLQDGIRRAPRGYCQDSKGTVVYVEDYANGYPGNPPPAYGSCRVDVYVRNQYKTTFQRNQCRAAVRACEQYVYNNHLPAYNQGRYNCVRSN